MTALLLLLTWLSLGSGALAGDLMVESWGRPVVVTVDGVIVGTTPISVSDLAGEEIEVGFRSRSSEPDVLTVPLALTRYSRAIIHVDISARLAEVIVEKRVRKSELEPRNGSATSPAALPGRDIPIAATAPTSAATGGRVGDVYVEADVPGAHILLDGVDTGQIAPATLKGLAVGTHRIDVRSDCAGAGAEVQVLDSRMARALLELEPGKGHLFITSVPAGAVVYFDGALAGNTPIELGSVPCMTHNLEVRAPDYAPVTERVPVRAFVDTKAHFDLVAMASGSLVIDVSPVTASVSLDGTVVSTGPITLDAVPVGTHRVQVEQLGYAPSERSITIMRGEVARVDVSLVPGAIATPRNTREPKVKSGPKRWPRLTLDTMVTGGGVALGVLAGVHYAQTAEDYQRFLDEPDDIVAKQIYTDDIRPRKKVIVAEAIGGSVLVASGLVLWITTDFAVAPTPGGLQLKGRW